MGIVQQMDQKVLYYSIIEKTFKKFYLIAMKICQLNELFEKHHVERCCTLHCWCLEHYKVVLSQRSTVSILKYSVWGRSY